jgi:hypothetical protein
MPLATSRRTKQSPEGLRSYCSGGSWDAWGAAAGVQTRGEGRAELRRRHHFTPRRLSTSLFPHPPLPSSPTPFQHPTCCGVSSVEGGGAPHPHPTLPSSPTPLQPTPTCCGVSSVEAGRAPPGPKPPAPHLLLRQQRRVAQVVSHHDGGVQAGKIQGGDGRLVEAWWVGGSVGPGGEGVRPARQPRRRAPRAAGPPGGGKSAPGPRARAAAADFTPSGRGRRSSRPGRAAPPRPPTDLGVEHRRALVADAVAGAALPRALGLDDRDDEALLARLAQQLAEHLDGLAPGGWGVGGGEGGGG